MVGVIQNAKNHPNVERMADEAIGTGGREGHGRVGPAEEGQPHLAQAEQVEVVDEEGAHQDQRPSEPEEHAQGHRAQGSSTDQIVTPMGRHSQKSSSSARLENST